MTTQYETWHHEARYADWMPVGEIRCLIIGGRDVGHYALYPKGGQVSVVPVQRTDQDTGPSWHSAGHVTWWPSEEAAVQVMEDHFRGVTRIVRGDVTERHLNGERLPDGAR